MAFEVVTYPEVYYDPADTVRLGAISRQIGWKAIVELYDAGTETRKWEYHCYGVPAPSPLPTNRYPGIVAVLHPPTPWPEIVANAPESSGCIFTQAFEAETNALVI